MASCRGARTVDGASEDFPARLVVCYSKGKKIRLLKKSQQVYCMWESG